MVVTSIRSVIYHCAHAMGRCINLHPKIISSLCERVGPAQYHSDYISLPKEQMFSIFTWPKLHNIIASLEIVCMQIAPWKAFKKWNSVLNAVCHRIAELHFPVRFCSHSTGECIERGLCDSLLNTKLSGKSKAMSVRQQRSERAAATIDLRSDWDWLSSRTFSRSRSLLH